MEQELALVKTEDLELLARRSLAADSARAKVAVSRLVAEILSRLDASVPVRSAAQALGRWHRFSGCFTVGAASPTSRGWRVR